MTLHTDVGYSTGTYRVFRMAEGEYTVGRYVRPPQLDADITAVAPLTDVLTIPAHGLSTGSGPLWVTTTGVLPATLAVNVPYWAIVTGPNTLKLAASKADALALIPIDITSTGSGTHHLATFFIINADVQNLGGAALRDLPEGQHFEATMKLYTDTELLSRAPGYEPDVIEYRGEDWRVFDVSYYETLRKPGHYRAFIERLALP